MGLNVHLRSGDNYNPIFYFRFKKKKLKKNFVWGEGSTTHPLFSTLVKKKFLGAISLGRVVVPSPKIVINRYKKSVQW